jgi:tRNA A37 threonylcarbamoyladenosine synthetase subunit TsaC/SUA5/YrdC
MRLPESTDSLHVLDKIPVNLQADEVLRRLKMRSENKRVEEMVRELTELVTATALPKVAYNYARVTARNGDNVEIEGVAFVCHAFRVFDRTKPVFPYIVTCGQELDALKFSVGEAMKTYALTIIKTMIVTSATGYLQDHLVKNYGLEQVSGIIPGHPTTWTIKQTKELVSLLGNLEEAIGIRLTDSMVLMPTNSVSGILYPTATRIERCHVCPNETCRERRTAYNSAVLE